MYSVNEPLQNWARERGVSVVVGERLQALWSGYGEIRRVAVERRDESVDGASDLPRSLVVKMVSPPERPRHPRGWAGEKGHARKLRSYEVEWAFYERWAGRCGDGCRVPRFIGGRRDGRGMLLVMSDLDHEGFSRRRRDLEATGGLSDEAIGRCLAWLAAFHATFLGAAADDLWPVGTYWHLATRPDELAAMNDAALRDAAPGLDALLNSARHQTLVHGDAKLANFCFTPDDSAVAAVDFQYVGGGVGVKDVAYFLGSVWDGDELERHAADAVDRYFSHLREALAAVANEQPEGNRPDFEAVEEEWRALYPVAWADFDRFLDGWAPGHQKRNRYAADQVEQALRLL